MPKGKSLEEIQLKVIFSQDIPVISTPDPLVPVMFAVEMNRRWPYVLMEGKLSSKPRVGFSFLLSFNSLLGSTYTCNPFSTNTGCPIGYDCSASTQAGVSVCCKTFTGN